MERAKRNAEGGEIGDPRRCGSSLSGPCDGRTQFAEACLGATTQIILSGKIVSHPSINTCVLVLMREGYIEVKIVVRSQTETDGTSELLKVTKDVGMRRATAAGSEEDQVLSAPLVCTEALLGGH